jgi:uncharacterized protein YkwD
VRFFSLLFLIPSFVFSQTLVNQDSLLFHFTKIINDYRVNNGLEKLEVDTRIKVLTDEWSKRMGETGKVGHGEGKESFQSRISREKSIPPSFIMLENCTELMTPDKPIKTSVKTYPELKPYIDGSYQGILNQYDYAVYGFLMWKNSPPHNKSMLDPDTKYFYLSSYRKNGRTYLCYISRG